MRKTHQGILASASSCILSIILILSTLSFFANTAYANDPMKGVALRSTTSVYSSVSVYSEKLKSYAAGSILLYRPYNADWYSARVYAKGKWQDGYIHKNHVDTAVQNQVLLSGIALKNPTSVYTSASTSSKALKSYSGGSILLYKTFSQDWYETSVVVKGKRKPGYIHRSHVENADSGQTVLRGIGLQSPTTVYANASTGSTKLKTYAQGSILAFRTFSSNWYKTTVTVKGKAKSGYINISHIEELLNTQKSLDGVTLKTPTNVYSRASKNAPSLMNYTKGNLVSFTTLSPNWYETKVNVNGKSQTGYLHKDDVNTERLITTTTSYNTNFDRVVDIQMTKAPAVSGKSGGFVDASKQQVEYYANSSNFGKNTNSYYQFLVLSQPAGLNATEVNEKILNNHGILTGKAKAFIDARKKYNVNEAYLISHALLETGNGKSILAMGVPVDAKGDVPRDSKGNIMASKAVHTVYNMYGIGAYDKCPIDCGAKKAFELGWFTPEAAIIGGADFISDYIKRGQDTLYKMRWNPISPGHPQYATDVAWAVKQTNNISKIYDLLDDYVLIYDVPVYANQPSSSGDPNAYLPEPKPEVVTNYPKGVYGVTNTAGTLNFREGPSTSTKSIASIPSGSKLEIIGNEGTWYKAIYSGKTGYVHSDYVNFLNLLEVTASSINVRDNAGTSSTTVIGSVKKGELIAAVLDSKDKLQTKSASGHVWYLIKLNGKDAWVSGGKDGTEFIKVK